jgi:hypothetical protein
MATVVLNPSSTVFNNWTIFGSESTVHEALADDTGVNTGVQESGTTRYFEVELDNLDSAGLNIDTITSIQATMEANNSLRSQTAVLDCSYRDSFGAIINGYTQDITISTTGTNTKYDWTARTTSDGSDAWTDGDIDGMRLRVVLDTAPAAGNALVYKLYLTVTYTEPPVITTYQSGEPNMKVEEGIIIIDEGVTIL